MKVNPRHVCSTFLLFLIAIVSVTARGQDSMDAWKDFEFGKKKLVLKAEGAEIGSSEVTLALPDYDGEEISIAFDPQYLIDMLRAIEGETSITLEMTSGEKPAVFRVGDNYLYLVMPLAG